MKNKVMRNASWIIGCKIVQSFINLIIGMLTARYLGPSNYGLISYASSIVAFVLPVAQLGLGKTLVQEIINHPNDEGKVVGTSIIINCIASLFCMIAVYIFLAKVDHNDKITITVGILCSFSLLFQATEMFQYWFQAKLMSKYISICSLIAYIFIAMYKVYLLANGNSVVWFAATNSVEYLLISVLLFVSYRKQKGPKLSISFKLGKSMIRKSKYYILSTMMVTIFAQTDKIMLKLMLGEQETGYYSAAITCIGLTSFVFAAIIDSMRPVILESKKKDQNLFENKVIQLYSIISILSIAQSLLMTIFAKVIIVILYGIEFKASVEILRIAVWYIMFSNYGSVRNIWILAENKQKYLWIINLCGAIFNVFLNYILIPICGGVGAAMASLLTQIFANIVVVQMISSLRYNNLLMCKGFQNLKFHRIAGVIINLKNK